MSNAAHGSMTEADYLLFELGSEERNEFLDGVIVAMTGASKRHNEIAGTLFASLRVVAKAHGCRTSIEGVRLRLSESMHVYPDVMVACDDNDDPYAEAAPCLIAEVLSPSTKWIDHGRKRAAYLGLASLRHYLLINPEQEQVEHYARSDADPTWTIALVGIGETLRLTCPPMDLALADIFA